MRFILSEMGMVISGPPSSPRIMLPLKAQTSLGIRWIIGRKGLSVKPERTWPMRIVAWSGVGSFTGVSLIPGRSISDNIP
jgi:hypothetical protein